MDFAGVMSINPMIANSSGSLSAELQQRISKVRLLLMDVDGVLTDGCLYVDDSGAETKRFFTRDGFALVWVRQYGLLTGVISGRPSPGTEKRCRDLKFDEVHLGSVHKYPVFEEIVQRRGLQPKEVAYLGDDVLDLPIMRSAGVSAAPSDSHPEVLRRVDLVLDYPGGRGAVRQFIDLWLVATGCAASALEDIYHGNF
jgi:3-deoxy-D-manno-octulosonate 8-phosphate phosphatase (KDO 8-P phosphatase)